MHYVGNIKLAVNHIYSNNKRVREIYVSLSYITNKTLREIHITCLKTHKTVNKFTVLKNYWQLKKMYKLVKYKMWIWKKGCVWKVFAFYFLRYLFLFYICHYYFIFLRSAQSSQMKWYTIFKYNMDYGGLRTPMIFNSGLTHLGSGASI